MSLHVLVVDLVEGGEVLMIDGGDPSEPYRPFCDRCGDKLVNRPLALRHARAVAAEHARRARHPVRIEPWDSFALVEQVLPPGWQTPKWGDPAQSQRPAEGPGEVA